MVNWPVLMALVHLVHLAMVPLAHSSFPMIVDVDDDVDDHGADDALEDVHSMVPVPDLLDSLDTVHMSNQILDYYYYYKLIVDSMPGNIHLDFPVPLYILQRRYILDCICISARVWVNVYSTCISSEVIIYMKLRLYQFHRRLP